MKYFHSEMWTFHGLTTPGFWKKPTAGPILLYANMPADPAAYQQLLQEVMLEGKPDLQFRPEFWSLYYREATSRFTEVPTVE